MVKIALPEIALQVRAIEHERGRLPYRVWLAPDASHRLMGLMWTRDNHPPVTLLGVETQGPLGMRLEIDHHLPPGVWRLTDEHGTLLYDCRQGQVVP